MRNEEIETEETGSYSEMMLRYLDELNRYYELMDANLIGFKGAEDYINATISKLLSIYTQLYPKIESGGEKTASLMEEFKTYEFWINKIQIMKVNKDEMDRIPDLYRLILKAYDALGLTGLR